MAGTLDVIGTGDGLKSLGEMTLAVLEIGAFVR